jgi:hypothetical protein
MPTPIPTASSLPTTLPTLSLLPSPTPTSFTLKPSPQPTFSSPLRRRHLSNAVSTSSSWCAENTPNVEVDNEDYLVASIMFNRTVHLTANIFLTNTLYFLIGVNKRLDGFVIDGDGQYKLDGRDSVRCLFIVGDGLRMGLKDLTVTNGYASASSTYGYYGGAIYVGDGAVLEMDGCTVSSSATANSGQGAGIYVDAATLILTDTTITNNYMYYGKGAGLYLTSLSKLTMSGGSITLNAQRSGYDVTYTYSYDGSIYRTCKWCLVVSFILSRFIFRLCVCPDGPYYTYSSTATCE